MEPTSPETYTTPTPPSSTPSREAPKQKGSMGGLLAIILILIIIVVGALYFWGQRIAESPKTPEDVVSDLETQSSSTDPSAIEADLNAETPEQFNADVDAAFDELDASFDAQ